MVRRRVLTLLYTSGAPIPFATMSNREWGQIGTNYFRGLFALAFQAFLMMVCVAIYAVLVAGIQYSDNLSSSLFGVMAYTVSYLQILAPELTDKMLAEFLDIDKNLIVNLHVQSVDQMKAIKLVKSKVTDINRMKIEEQKKAVRSGYDMGATRSLITA